MFGKHFQSMYTGSMAGSGAVVFAVWGYVISHAYDGTVEMNPLILSTLLGESQDEIEKAINTLCSPDPQSRHKEHEGRRLVKDVKNSFLYFVPSHPFYRDLRTNEERRTYFRDAKRRERERKAESNPVKPSVKLSSSVNAMSTKTETEEEYKKSNVTKHDVDVASHFVGQTEKHAEMVRGKINSVDVKKWKTTFDRISEMENPLKAIEGIMDATSKVIKRRSFSRPAHHESAKEIEERRKMLANQAQLLNEAQNEKHKGKA